MLDNSIHMTDEKATVQRQEVDFWLAWGWETGVVMSGCLWLCALLGGAEMSYEC